MARSLLGNLESGLLSEDNITTDGEIVDGDAIVEEIAAGNEDIIPDDYSEINGDFEIVENLTDAIEEEETIMEEVEVPLVTEGQESDFNKTTSILLATSNRRLNALLGAPEGKGLPTDGLLSDSYGSYKKAFKDGLEAKEGYLKALKEKAKAAWKKLLETIKKYWQKSLIFFNGAEKSASKLLEVLKGKGKLKDEKDKLTDADKNAVADKFGAWMGLGNKMISYPSYADQLSSTKIVPSASGSMPVRAGNSNAPSKDVLEKLGAKDGETVAVLNLTGKIAKYLVYKTEGGNKAENVKDISIASYKFDFDGKKVDASDVPTIKTLEDFATSAKKLGAGLKSGSSTDYKNAESFVTGIEKPKDGEEDKTKSLQKVGNVAMRCALENVSAQMSAAKTMLWFASYFAKRYVGKDAETKDTKEDK